MDPIKLLIDALEASRIQHDQRAYRPRMVTEYQLTPGTIQALLTLGILGAANNNGYNVYHYDITRIGIQTLAKQGCITGWHTAN